jgi:hypothetical protein
MNGRRSRPGLVSTALRTTEPDIWLDGRRLLKVRGHGPSAAAAPFLQKGIRFDHGDCSFNARPSVANGLNLHMFLLGGAHPDDRRP